MELLDILRRKRDGCALTQAEIAYFVRSVTDGTAPDYQTAAMLMAIYFRGMTDAELAALTECMADSGDRLDWSSLGIRTADKHSTGGVGDKTSLIAGPIAAALGGIVPKMSGRGLGFTGGTLDKLESVPGLSVSMDTERFIETVNKHGLAIIGQTKSLAPADKVLYALRDVTGTVDCLPLVGSSILSKKIAAGADVIVLDVKTGSGAIMPTYEKSLELARTMVDIGNRTGRKFAALVTDMNQPLGNYVGNALEVYEAIEILSGRAEGDLKTVSLMLGAHILRLAGVVSTVDEGVRMLEEKIRSGEGLKKLSELFACEGGDPRVPYEPDRLPKAPKQIDLFSDADGYVAGIHTDKIGYAAKALGAGRERKEDKIDLSVGIVMKKRLGDRVKKGEPLLTMHVSEISDVPRAEALAREAFRFTDTKPETPELIRGVVE